MESIAKSELENKLLIFCEQILNPLGFRTVDLDCVLARRSLIRIFVERLSSDPTDPNKEAQDTRVTVDDCAQVSSVLNPALDIENFVPGAYDLEVSSPGLDRRLRLRSDFERCIGSEVKLKLAGPVKGVGANVRGTLVGVENGSIKIDYQGSQVAIPLLKVKRSHLVWQGPA